MFAKAANNWSVNDARTPSTQNGQDGCQAVWLTTTPPKPVRTFEIVLRNKIDFIPRNENSIQHANFYPDLGIIATGKSYAQLPTHNQVHRRFVAWARNKLGFDVQVPNRPPIRLFRLGKNVVMCLDSHANIWDQLSSVPSPDSQKQANQLLLAYAKTAKDLLSKISSQGGKTVALCDSDAQIEFFSKILPIALQHSTNIHFSLTDDLTPIVNAFADGKDYIIRLESLVESDLARIEQLLAHYETAIQMATARIRQTGGRVILAADTGPQKLIAKLLGRLDQVENGAQSGRTGAEFVRKAIQESLAGRHLKSLSSGTRYFFPDDLTKLVQLAALPEAAANHLDEGDRVAAIAQHRSSLLSSITELTHFLTCVNRTGHREGQIFLVQRDTQQLVTDIREQQKWAQQFAGIKDSIERSEANWLSAHSQIKHELEQIVQKLHESCHPAFRKIDLESPVFVRLVNRALRSDSTALDLGEEVSTPLTPVEVGYYDPGRRGGKTLKVTSKRDIIKAVVRWLVSEDAAAVLRKGGASLFPLDADYIVAYQPDRPISQEVHPTNFIARFGHTEPKESFVFEWGTAKGGRERWVIDSNVWSPSELIKRAKRIRENRSKKGKNALPSDTLCELLESSASDPKAQVWTSQEISRHIADFKLSQYRLFNTILSAMTETQVKLAPPYSLASIQEGPMSDDFRIRPYVDGRRLDLMRFTEWDVTRLEHVLLMEADLMAAGIIAQLPHLPQHDIIISADRQNKTINGLTYLSPGESFCHSSSKDHKEYLDEIVPVLCGNAIARLVAQIGYASSSSTVKREQARLINVCVQRIKKQLEALTDAEGGEGSPRAKILADFEKAAISTADCNSYRSPMLQICQFVPTSCELLNMTGDQLKEVVKKITKFARAELTLIRTIAPATENNEDAATCATAISSLIGRHVSEGRKSRQVIEGLANFKNDLNELSIIERAWYIILLDVHVRMDELHSEQSLGAAIKTAFSKTNKAEEFYNELTKTASDLDITFETTTALHQALSGLTAAYSSVGCSDVKRKQLTKILPKVPRFKNIILPRRSNVGPAIELPSSPRRTNSERSSP
jgi:hypothetical protein